MMSMVSVVSRAAVVIAATSFSVTLFASSLPTFVGQGLLKIFQCHGLFCLIPVVAMENVAKFGAQKTSTVGRSAMTFMADDLYQPVYGEKTSYIV